MYQQIISIRPFIGCADFNLSRGFYTALGFQETVLFHNMSLFSRQGFAFYLQDAYVKDWVDNTMLFLQVQNADAYYDELTALDLPGKYKGARLSPVRQEPWGRQCFLHDPSGILWHIGAFI
jgi:catechol 2,3-dioxygenase-like lactoylglutathione lyase family enzyme